MSRQYIRPSMPEGNNNNKFLILNHIIMKRKLHLMMAVAIVAVAGLAIFASQPKENKSDVMLANIEALVGAEWGETVYCCGNYGECMVVLNGTGTIIRVAGIKLTVPCPY